MAKILITGGGGFVGSHLADELLDHGYEVRVLDSLTPQVHEGRYPDYLRAEVEFMEGDVRDAAAVDRAVKDVDYVYHLAATVGVGQSMYEIERYMSVNAVGTGVVLEALMRNPVKRLVVASSMSIYGEGLYRSIDGRWVEAPERTIEQLRAKQWELTEPDGSPLIPIPTPEIKRPALSSIYAISKYVQERMCLNWGQAYNVPTVALRFFNIYGTRQALSNPYTGVLAIFASRYLNNAPPQINEDGLQKRDFVSVRDIAFGCRLALEAESAAGQVFNLGSGQPRSILEIAKLMGETFGKEFIEPEVNGKCRLGDIRNCYADITRAKAVLGYAPRVDLQDGLAELAVWLDGRTAEDRYTFAAQELAARGLTV